VAGLASAAGATGRPNAAFVDCMHSHGVDLGAQGLTNAPDASTLHAAQQACDRLLPVVDAPGMPAPELVQRMLAYARCLRAHGAVQVPDPSISNGGVAFEVPQDVYDSPAYQHALPACRAILNLQSPTPGPR
jgi:hypothetical protein